MLLRTHDLRLRPREIRFHRTLPNVARRNTEMFRRMENYAAYLWPRAKKMRELPERRAEEGEGRVQR